MNGQHNPLPTTYFLTVLIQFVHTTNYFPFCNNIYHEVKNMAMGAHNKPVYGATCTGYPETYNLVLKFNDLIVGYYYISILLPDFEK